MAAASPPPPNPAGRHPGSSLVHTWKGLKTGQTIIQKIPGKPSASNADPGDIIDVAIDVRIARDFGGANVVKNLRENGLPIHAAERTFFTFDCNPGGCDQQYATNQHLCRLFARSNGIKVFDIERGIGTHLVIDEGIAQPAGTIVSTDSHANILGAIGAFGQGMGDSDIAHAFAYGRVWFKVPRTVKLVLRGTPSSVGFPERRCLEDAATPGRQRIARPGG